MKRPAHRHRSRARRLVLFFSSVYTLSETEQAILTQFGRPVGGVVKDPGLHLKVPLVQEVHRFDKRWLEYDGDPNEIPTQGQEVHLGRHVRSLAHRRPAALLPGRAGRAGRAEPPRRHRGRRDAERVASFDLIEVVRSTNRTFQVTEDLEGIGAAEAMAKVSAGRGGIAKIILDKAAEDHARVRDRARGREVQAHQLRRERAAEGLRADDLGAKAHRRAEPFRGPGARRRDPRPEGARRPRGLVRRLQDRPGGQGNRGREGHRRSTRGPTAGTPTSTSS